MTISIDDLTTIFPETTTRTFENWRKKGFPAIAAERLSLYDGTHEGWQGFQIRQGFIITPSGIEIAKHQIDQLPWLSMTLKEQTRLNIVLKSQLKTKKTLAESSNAEFCNLDKLIDFY